MRTRSGPRWPTTDTGEQPVVSHAADETGVLPATKWRTFGQEPTERPATRRSPAPAPPEPARTGSTARRTGPARYRAKVAGRGDPGGARTMTTSATSPTSASPTTPTLAHRPTPARVRTPARPADAAPSDPRRSAGEVEDRLQPGVGLVAVQAVATVQLHEGVGDLPGAARSGPRSTVASPVPVAAHGGVGLLRPRSPGSGRSARWSAARASPTPLRSPAAMSSAPLLARSWTACWQSRSDQRG